MKNSYGFIGKVDEKLLSLSDAFVDYLNDNYFPDAADVLDSETIDFEYNNFLNAYAK